MVPFDLDPRKRTPEQLYARIQEDLSTFDSCRKRGKLARQLLSQIAVRHQMRSHAQQILDP